MYTTPVRKWKNGRYGNNHWFKYSPKIKRNIDMYSDLEYDHWILIENDPNVITYCEQPVWVKDVIDGEIINTIFDMWVKLKNGFECFVEIKYGAELDPSHEKYSSRSATQVDQQRRWCLANGLNYEVRTEEFIHRNKLLLQNYKSLLPYINERKVVIKTDRQIIKALMNVESTLSIAAIEQLVTEIPKYRIRDAIYNMIYDGALGVNIDKVRLGRATEVWLR
jgi:hypothetical protein